MRATGIVRKIDELGRVVIPVELRRTFGIEIKDGLELFIEGDRIILRKYRPDCIFCGGFENINNFKGKRICRDCLDKMTGNKE